MVTSGTPAGGLLEELEAAVERLLVAYRDEKGRTRELMIQVADLEARLARSPAALGELQDANRRLRRNAAVAAAKVEDLMNRL